MSRKKKKSNGAGEPMVTGDVIGREQRIVHRELEDHEVEDLRIKLHRTYTTQREVQAIFKAFRKWAEPRVRAAFDPDYANSTIEGEKPLSDVEARALMDELDHRRRLRGSQIGAIKAERRLLQDAIANEYEHRVIECECRMNVEGLTVDIVDPVSSEVIDRRPMTAAERQMTMLETGSNGVGAPDAVM